MLGLGRFYHMSVSSLYFSSSSLSSKSAPLYLKAKLASSSLSFITFLFVDTEVRAVEVFGGFFFVVTVLLFVAPKVLSQYGKCPKAD